MIKTFWIAFRLQITYRVNTIIYSLKQLPLIKRILPVSLYASKSLKAIASVISLLWEIITIFLYKGLYLGLFFIIPILFSNIDSSLQPAFFLTATASEQLLLRAPDQFRIVQDCFRILIEFRYRFKLAVIHFINLICISQRLKSDSVRISISDMRSHIPGPGGAVCIYDHNCLFPLFGLHCHRIMADCSRRLGHGYITVKIL